MKLWSISILFVLSLILFLASALRSGKKEQREGRLTAKELSGFCLWQSIDKWFNYILFPTLMGAYGWAEGSLWMTVIALIVNVIYILTNNATEIDWTMMSWVTYLRDSQSPAWPLRYARLINRKYRRPVICVLALARKLIRIKIGRWELSKPLVFIILTVWKDSFYAINFLYHKEVDLRNWKTLGLFLISHVICCAAWVPVAGSLGMAGKFVLNALFS
jgi:hypothetical protein